MEKAGLRIRAEMFKAFEEDPVNTGSQKWHDY